MLPDKVEEFLIRDGIKVRIEPNQEFPKTDNTHVVTIIKKTGRITAMNVWENWLSGSNSSIRLINRQLHPIEIEVLAILKAKYKH